MDRIAITGIGTISAAGADIAQTLCTFERGERNAGLPSLFSTSLPYPVFEARNLPSTEGDGQRTLCLSMIAVREALSSAELPIDLSGHKVGVCLGTTVASQLNDMEFYRVYRDTHTIQMTKVDRYLKGNLAETVALCIKSHGPAITVANACSSGADAIGVALSWMKNGICDIAIAGGADELNYVPFCGFGSLGIVSKTLCAPFDRDRSGLNLGEGAGILVLEREADARRRGVDPKVSLAGYGSASDAYHLTAPHPDGIGLEFALRMALHEAGIGAQDIGFVNAHGTATRDNDRVETMVFKKIFGKDLKFMSTKGFTGHTLGAAGGLEAAFTVAALENGWMPPSAGFANMDKEIELAPVVKKTPVKKRAAVSTSLAFGGNNAALVFISLPHKND